MTAAATTEFWHYARAGQQHGPIEASAFRAMAARGEILPTDLVWTTGMPQWVAAGSIEGLLPARSANEPPPIPPPAPQPIGYFAPPSHQPEDSLGTRMMLPVGRTGLSITAGYLGLLSLLPIFAPFALIVSMLAIRELRRKPHMHGMGRAIFGLIMGIIFTLGLILLVGLALSGR